MHLRLVIATQQLPLLRLPPGFEPRGDFLRKTHPGDAVLAEHLQSRFGRAGAEQAGVVKQPAEPGRQPTQSAFDPERGATGIGDKIHAGRSIATGLLEQSPVARFQQEQDRLDVFTRAQPVAAKVRAFTRKLAVGDIADLYCVGHATVGLDAKIGKDRMCGVGIGDVQRLGARPQPAFVDFVLIGRAPIMGWRHLNVMGLSFHKFLAGDPLITRRGLAARILTHHPRSWTTPP